MDKRTRLLLVSFGNSKQYRLEYKVPEKATALHKPSPVENIEEEVRQYLEKEFPGQYLAYFTTPKVEEMSLGHKATFDTYPPLNADAIKEIEYVLSEEVKVQEANRRLNHNAYYAEVAPNTEL